VSEPDTIRAAVIGGLGCALLALAGLPAGAQGGPQGMPPSPVRYTEARNHPVRRTLVLSGSVESRVESVVAAEVAALVVELEAREGDTVEKGAPLVRMRTTTFEIRLQVAEAQHKEAEARMKLAELYGQRRDVELQESALREAVSADPRNAAAVGALARFLFDTRRLEDAEQLFLQMLAGDLQPEAALTGLGDVHAAQGDFTQAAEDYRQAIARTTDARIRRDLEQKLRNAEQRRR